VPPKAAEIRRQAKALFEGEALSFAYESVRLFVLCDGTRWAHLPVSGGWYDQHPMLLDEWEIIIAVRGEHQRAQENKNRPSAFEQQEAGMRR
jgi:hypothetical protein